MKSENTWKQICEKLNEHLEFVLYKTWIDPLKFLKYDSNSGILFLQAENDFKKTTLEDRYRHVILQQSSVFFKSIKNITFLLPDETGKFTKKDSAGSSLKSPDEEIGDEETINPMKTFETFIEGDNSRFAYAAALNVAESAKKPSPRYNPLFIYGDSGLGKTHLMNAIANFVMSHSPKLKIIYVSSEKFTNEYITYSRNKKMNEFKSKYRHADVLMIDDIQFIEKKEKTEEEVFHTYEALYGMGNQLVFSSDRPPTDLFEIEDRLKSRLCSSFIVDLQPPAFEIKVAILHNKAILESIELTDGLKEVINLIAEKIKSDVRALEGAFDRVVGYSKLLAQPVTKSLARQVLNDVISAQDVKPTADSIKKAVSKHYGIKLSDLESSNRSRIFSTPRQVAMYLCREMTDLSFPSIGASYNRHYTTVMHAHEIITDQIKNNNDFAGVIGDIKSILENQ